MNKQELEPMEAETVGGDDGQAGGIVKEPGQAGVITALARLPERALMDGAAMADILGVSDRTVRRMVSRGELPPGIKMAGRNSWLAGRVLDWIETRAERLEKEAEKNFSKIRQVFS